MRSLSESHNDGACLHVSPSLYCKVISSSWSASYVQCVLARWSAAPSSLVDERGHVPPHPMRAAQRARQDGKRRLQRGGAAAGTAREAIQQQGQLPWNIGFQARRMSDARPLAFHMIGIASAPCFIEVMAVQLTIPGKTSVS